MFEILIRVESPDTARDLMSLVIRSSLYEGVHSMRIAQFTGSHVEEQPPCSCEADRAAQPDLPIEPHRHR
ncbi:MAG: hypothetical protein GC161_18980 [Planctomycetaceae bacterium]|nr:hypothetical protein [Planctomycetaceae bacterium]